MTELERLAARLQEFAEVRDWEQFHTPKNLAMALCVGRRAAAELQWLDDQGGGVTELQRR